MAFNTEGLNPAVEAFGWGDEIIDDGASFEEKPLATLPEGEYEFTVIKFTKGSQAPSPKIPNGCNRAELILKITDGEHDSLINDNLFLIRSMEWKLSSFFRSIGQKKHGEALAPNWNAVKGAKGRAYFKVEEYNANDGTKKTKNVVDKYIDALPFE